LIQCSAWHQGSAISPTRTIKKGKALKKGYTNVRKPDFTDLASPNKSCNFVLLPCFDSSSVPEKNVEMIEAVSFMSFV